jgi:chitodextrinase
MSDEIPFLAPPAEEELPPPPSDIAEQSKNFDGLKVKKPKPLSTVRRAFVIFEKDMRTMAKHGLVSSVILFVFLAIVFYIMSFTMVQAVKFDIGGNGGNGGDGGEGIPAGSGVDLPVAHMSIRPGGTISAGTSLTLDGSASTDNSKIVFYVWNINDGYQEQDVFSDVIHHAFSAVGNYEVRLTVVDDEWNMNETSSMIQVNPVGSDSNPPMAMAEPVNDLMVGQTATFDASNSTDDTGVVDYTWLFHDGIDRTMDGVIETYTFNNAGDFNVELVVRDAAGNIGQTYFNVHVQHSPGDDKNPEARTNVPLSVSIGDEVQLDASDSNDDQGISQYTWYVMHNGTLTNLMGEKTSFIASDYGPYFITLMVRDSAGNTGEWQGMTIATPAGMELDKISWTATPFGTDISFNVLTYSYGIALLASVIYVGGLFAKGFTHEITKGTVKVLFFGPISVTTMVFSKILYPLIIGPIFIFPLVAIGLSQFDHPLMEVLMITLVSYAFAAVTMVSAAYGSALLYLGTKKMSVKPSVFSRMFLYFSLLGTLTVFEWMSFLLDQWQGTDSWGVMYDKYGAIAALSPFHQGGMMLSNALIGTHWTIDLWVFAIPTLLIIGGALASRKLYGDIYSRE